MKRILSAMLLAAVPITASAAGHPAPLAPLHTLASQGARVSALVVRLGNDQALAALHPGLALTPASVSKLYVTAAAFDEWGPAHRFETRLLATGPVNGHTLHGDLVFAGAGDPAFTSPQLFALVRRLAARGIQRVDGDLVVDASRFGKLSCTARDRCRARRASHNAYNAPLSAAATDFATAQVGVTPAASAGAAAAVALQPYNVPSVRLVDHVRTVRSGAAWTVHVSRTTRGGDDIITATGAAPASASTHYFWRAVSAPARMTGEELRALLAASGITVTGKLRVVHKGPIHGRELARLKGQPLWIQARRMLTWSNNFMADTLALDLLRTRQAPPLSVAAAGKALTRRARQLESGAGNPPGWTPHVVLDSGSGLTTSSRASARDLVALLSAMYRRPGLFPAFLGALTVPAHTPVDMLKAPSDASWMQGIAAKTGSLNEPHSVFALAGYARLADGHWGAFAVLVNGTRKHEVPLSVAIAATRAALTPFLQSPHAPARP